ncbi:2-hydroxyacid dehydrogenase [Pseudaestuariivita rosea]|uniref:2-hydroxyacid dehydrogenase n=1 Tax=Pseudaestuariivita rosea TaxID=2763263 RepID=UPI001ABAF57B|nr:D-glycerate dehydrogenase [Pseudaestuariivita rosea]
MTRLLVTRHLPDDVLNAIPDAFDVTVRENQTPMDCTEAAQALQTYDAILPTLGDDFGAETFRTPDITCRILANFGVGYNHIDVAAAEQAGVAVTNTPGAVTDATADIALTLMLMSCRRAGEGERLVRAGEWSGWHPTQMLGLHMSGKVLGIIGMGRIGQAIAKRAHLGFGMQVVFFNRSPKPDAIGQQMAEIDDVLKKADIVVIAVPATPETHHLISAAQLAAMKPTGHLINVARGDIVDQSALITALKTGQIAGAGLDVYEFEPEVPDDLRQMENVVLLPHLGTAALEVRIQMGLMAVENLAAYLAGDPLPNKVFP